MALTEQERAKIRYFLGYPNWSNLALSWGLRFPTELEAGYQINSALDRLTDEGVELVRADLRELEDIKTQLSKARRRLAASKIGEIATNPGELTALRGEYETWKKQLADHFGSVLNPWREEQGSSRCGTTEVPW